MVFECVKSFRVFRICGFEFRGAGFGVSGRRVIFLSYCERSFCCLVQTSVFRTLACCTVGHL